MKKLSYLLLAFALGFGKVSAQKTSVTLTNVVSKDSKFRIETLTKNLNLNSDLYSTVENDFYKIRLQSLPLKYKSFSFGGASEYKSGDKYDIGPVLRFKLKNENFTLKSDIRYYVLNKSLDGLIFFDSKRIFSDCRWQYNLNNTGFLRFGADYKFNDKLSLGVEANFKKVNDEFVRDYIGPRLKFNF